MECIDRLKQIGIKEINIKTKIANKRLEDIFGYHYDEIDKTRARGFINILEREYKIDMSEWLNAYNEYHRQQEELLQQEEEKENLAKEKVNISIVDATIKDKAYMNLFVLFVVLVVLFIAYFVYNNLILNQDSTIDSTPIYTESYHELKSITNDNPNSNATINNTESLGESAVDSNVSDFNVIDSNTMDSDIVDSNELDSNISDSNATIAIDSSESIDVDFQSLNQSIPNPTESSVDEVSITPKDPLWVGIIDLQTYTKKQMSISSVEKITLDNDKLIRTGHSSFDIVGPKFSKKYIGGENKYFLYTLDSGLKEITKSEFLSFNRGEEW